MRNFAIIDVEGEHSLDKNIIEKINGFGKIIVFTTVGRRDGLVIPDGVDVEIIPDDIASSEPKTRNFISRRFLDAKTDGFLHVIQNNVVINESPEQFMSDLEEMMEKFKLKSWFNCSCDPVNYVYSKFNPRFVLVVDDDECTKSYDKDVLLCSNANTVWICYDIGRCEFEDMRFEEKFRIPMFFIIEFLARRRNRKSRGEFNYMNMYPTVPSELGVFTAPE